MNARTFVRLRNQWQLAVVAILLIAGAIWGARLAYRYSVGGSMVTNADGFASGRIAAGITAVRH